MTSKPQQSKRDRGRQHLGLPPKREPTFGFCPLCGEGIWNRGAHAEACTGRWTGWHQLAGLCGCNPTQRTGGRCVHGNPYMPVMRTQTPFEQPNMEDVEKGWPR